MTEYLKARTSTRDVVADYLEEFQRPDNVSKDITELCPAMVDDALKVIVRSGSQFDDRRSRETALTTPWVPFGDEQALNTVKILGQVRVEAVVPHTPIQSGELLRLVGETTIKLLAQPNNASQQMCLMAVLTPGGFKMKSRGPGFFEGNRGDLNYIRYLMTDSLRDIVLPRNRTSEAEQHKDQAADQARRHRKHVDIRGDSL